MIEDNIKIDILNPGRDNVIKDITKMIQDNNHIVAVFIGCKDLNNEMLNINASIIQLQTNKMFRIAFLEFIRNHLNEITNPKEPGAKCIKKTK